ncbi:MAG: hypothetical protein U9R13_05965 [Campylobacterota bacterium]|nr:hypothetical protein [Campylobacterota bacterium]
MKKLLEILLIAVVFFSLGMYVGQDKDATDTTITATEAATDTTSAVKVPESKPEPKPEPKAKPKAVQSKNLAVVYTFDKDIEAEYNELTEKKVQTIGFALTDPHKRVNDHYEEKYGSTKLDFLSFQSIVNDEKIKPLLNIDPRIAGFSPFNLLGYKKQSDKQTYVMHLVPEVILDIIGIDDEKLRTAYIESFVELDALIEKELGGTKSYIKYDKLAEKRMMNFELTFDRPKDLTDFVDDFQEKFEESFEEGGYLIAGYYNFKENGEDTIPEYDAFWTYALCHFKFSYTVFDNEGGRPKAGIFAPCAMYMYVKKDTSTLVIGMPTLANWGATLKIDDPKRAEFIKKLDKEIPALLESLGAKPVANVNPLTRESTASNAVSKTASAAAETVEEKKPEAVASPREVTTPSTAGHIEKEFVSAYLRGPLATASQVEADLKNAGFEVLGVHDIDKKGDLTSIIFTCPGLKKMASKKTRGFMGALKVLVDDVNKQISIGNPLYFAKAYLQDDFDKVIATKVLDKLNKTFENLKNAKDGMEFDDLSGYHFAMSMPYYEDMESVASGDNAKLLEKAKASGSVVFELTLDNGATLLGVKLDKRTTKFAKKIGANNASVIPYTVLIENGEAKVLAPKYNLALHYPLLSMTGFMTIATVPGAIIKDCKKVFQ